MAAVAGLRGTGDWGTDERPKNFREMILFRNPNGSAPLFALMARVQKESTDDPEFSWWDEPNDIIRLQVNGALASGDTLIAVDSSDPDASNPDNRWGLATHLVPGDLLLVEPTSDSATYNHEIIEVVTVHSATAFTATRGAAGTSAASISDDQFLLKIGNTFGEGTAEPNAASRNPIKYFNYTQIFKTTYELTGTATQTRTRTGDPLKMDKRRKSFDHSRDIEHALLWGTRSETTGTNGKPKRTFRGLRGFVGNTKILAANWAIANPASAGNSFLDAVSPVFNWESEAGDERIVFAGNGALNRLNEALHKAPGGAASQIRFNGGEKVFGMNFQRMELPQGSVFIRRHPLMSRHPLYTNSMFVIDFSALRYRPLRNRDTKSMDDIQTKGEDVRRGMWQTEAGLEVGKGGLTCAYIGGFDAAIG